MLAALREIEQHDQVVRQGQARADGGQPPAGRVGGQALPGQRAVPAGSRPGGQYRTDEGGGPLPVSARLQVLDVRHLVDPAGDHPGHRRPFADDPHPGAHGGDAQPHLARESRSGQRDGARAHAGGAGQADGRAHAEGAADPGVLAQAPVAGDADRRGFPAGRFPRGQGRRLAQRQPDQPGPDDSGGARAVHAVSQGEEDSPPALRYRRGRRAHLGGGRQALRGDAGSASARSRPRRCASSVTRCEVVGSAPSSKTSDRTEGAFGPLRRSPRQGVQVWRGSQRKRFTATISAASPHPSITQKRLCLDSRSRPAVDRRPQTRPARSAGPGIRWRSARASMSACTG